MTPGPLSRRSLLLGGLGAAATLTAGAGAARALTPEGSGPFGGSSAGSADHLLSGLHEGLVVTDLEVVTVTDTSITFSWATYPGPHPFYGTVAPTVATDAEVRLAPAGAPGPLPVVHHDDEPRGFHLVTVEGLAPGTEYAFECRSGGIAARPGLMSTHQMWSPERTGRVTTLTPPPGAPVGRIAVINDVHIGEERHGILVAGMPTPIVQAEGLPPFPDLMLAGALAEIRARGVDRLLVNGDTTDEARPAEVARFVEIMNGYGAHGVDWHVTRGNHDRPHTPSSDPAAGYERHAVLPGTADHRDPWGEALVPRQQMWTTRVGGLRIMGIDSTHLDASGGMIEPHQHEAIEAELATDPHRPTLVLAHHPVTREAAFTNAAGPSFVVPQHDADRLQSAFTRAPGVFLMAAGHTHRAKRTAPDAARGVDFVEFGSCAGYPGGYTIISLHTGGYMVNFHRTGTPEALDWSARSRWAAYGLNPEYTLGTTAHRNYVVHRDLAALG
ncbi:MAG TPA: hypothetical protein GX694_03705 [Actinomycetales bacterium]|nr:hypothetical protein [Actinomycetales bacterium]